MKRATETRFGPHPLAVLAVALTTLAGCDEALIAGNSSSDEKSQTDSGKTELLPEVTGTSQRDVEAPDVFQVTEAGLWDGRPSLGGIWVAHPNATQPERVVIKNTSNNKSVTGALFRRELNLPGPALQVSSAAAEQLGMLAGAPTRLEVVALRRETVEPVAPPAAEPEVEPEIAPKVAEDAVDESTVEETAEPAAESNEKPAKRKWWQKKAPADDVGSAAVGVAAGATAAGVAASEEVAASGAASEEIAESTSTTANLSDPTVTPPAEKPKKRKWWQKKDPNEITETQLDPIAGAAAAIEASDPAPVSASAPPAAETEATAAVSTLTKPYVQIGTFGVEANANAAAEKVRRNGIGAQVLELTSEGKSVWRVLVGPSATRAERKAILGDVKDLGFTDAYIVKN